MSELPEYKTDKPRFDRITVVEHVYHQTSEQQPTVHERRFFRMLASDEQCYVRVGRVGEERRPLDLGWLAGNVGMLVITNDEGVFTQSVPTQEQIAEARKKILELGAEVLVPPGESVRITPAAADKLSVRSRSGVTKYTLKLWPL